MAFMIHISDGSTFIDYRDKVSLTAPNLQSKKTCIAKLKGVDS
jgi:hypothetical protein